MGQSKLDLMCQSKVDQILARSWIGLWAYIIEVEPVQAQPKQCLMLVELKFGLSSGLWIFGPNQLNDEAYEPI